MTQKTYTELDIAGEELTIRNDITEAIINFTQEATCNIVTLEGRTDPIKVVVSGLSLKGSIDIAKDNKDNKLEYKGECKVTSPVATKAAIHVGQGTKLEIYCLSTHTETNKNILICDVDDGDNLILAAGIGGNGRSDATVSQANGEDAGEIIIRGNGKVSIYEGHDASFFGAGIGGGGGVSGTQIVNGGAGGIITIGEKVKVYSQTLNGAGIGGGCGNRQIPTSLTIGGAGGTITISEEAEVYAHSGNGAAIGGGGGYKNQDGEGAGGDGGITKIIGIGKVEASTYGVVSIGSGDKLGGGKDGDILIANPNIIVSNSKPMLLTKSLVYYDGPAYSNRTIGLIEVDGANAEINKYMTGTDENGELKYYYHRETGTVDGMFKFTNNYPDYNCITDLINQVDLQKLKFPCERKLSRGINFYI